ALIDGEMVVQDECGVTDFHALRSAIYTAPHRIVFFAFDLLHLNGEDLRGRPLMERRALLRRLIRPGNRSPIQFSDHVQGDGARFFKAAVDLGLEGIVSKRAASPIAADRPAHGLRPRTWSKASSCFSAPTGMRTASPGRCWPPSAMATSSSLAPPS